MPLLRCHHLEIQGSPDDSSTDYGHRSQKQKAPFPQGVTTVDHWNPAPNHSQNVTKVQEVKTSDSSDNCDVSWEFQSKFPIHM